MLYSGPMADVNRFKQTLKTALEYALPWIILAILLAYSYADFFRHPYGFWWGTPDGTVARIFVIEREPTLQVGDKLIRVGPVTLQSFNNDLRKELFAGVQPGQLVPITVQRGNQTLTVDWRLPGTNLGEQLDQLSSQWFLAYFFWLAGALTLLVLRPRDQRWFLMAAFNFLTALWLVTGSGLSFFHIWYSALVMRAAVWLCVPVYLHLHWVFPRPLSRLPTAVIAGAYAIGGGLVVLQWFQLLPSSLYFVGFLVAILGSLVLLALHWHRQPELRRDVGLLLLAAALAVVPSVALAILGSLEGSVPVAAGLGLLSLPLLPFAYLYAAYRKQLGGMELRVNRLLTIYVFMIVLGLIIVPLLVVIDGLPRFSPDQTLISGAVASVLVTVISLWGFPVFQRHVERRFFRISVPSRDLQQVYTSHITSSTSLSSLSRLLAEEIMPSLLVRQFVFLALEDGASRVLLKTGVTEEQIPRCDTRAILSPLVGRHLEHELPDHPELSWLRLVLPLRLQDNMIGFWLFGRRDPDDLYSAVEIPILQSFANQTAIALSNILQTERLRAMYQANIDRHENERRSLARDLHDSVLSELAGMLMNADVGTLPKSFQEGYQALTQRLRDIVSELRPPMLNYGLKPAIDELADILMERTNDTVTMIVELDSAGDRYPPDKEQHLFRIVQEACENAIRHSKCKQVTVTGQLAENWVEICVEDNGNGFQLPKQHIELYDLLSQRHFGLAGMYERAELIEAQIQITSAPGAGTRVIVRWHGR